MSKKFKPADISRTIKALKNKSIKLYEIMSEITISLRKNTEKLLEISSKTGILISDAQFIELEKYLRILEVFAMRPGKAFLPLNPIRDDFKKYNEINDMLNAQNIVVQPGLRYAQADIILSLIKKEAGFKLLDIDEQNLTIKVFLNGVYGIMQKDIILYETMQKCKLYGSMKPWDNYWPRYASLPIVSYKAIFPNTNYDPIYKEIDLIIENNEDNTIYLVEIKHSDQRNKNQTKWLTDKNVLDRIKAERKEIKSQSVLYHGKTCLEDEIKYVNIEEYLITLDQKGIESTIQLLSNK